MQTVQEGTSQAALLWYTFFATLDKFLEKYFWTIYYVKNHFLIHLLSSNAP